MKTIGLLGGMSWLSSALYYRLLNQGIHNKLGGLHSASIILHSVDFAEIERFQRQQDWAQAGALLAEKSLQLQQAGADFLVIATNTMHIVLPEIERTIDIPVLHIADATADAINKQGFTTIGLLGTRFTMQMDYYKSRLRDKGLRVITPDDADCTRINDIIFNELCHGLIQAPSRQDYLAVIQKLVEQGAECIILGCTEITLLLQQSHTPVPLFDTTALHAEAAVVFALDNG